MNRDFLIKWCTDIQKEVHTMPSNLGWGMVGRDLEKKIQGTRIVRKQKRALKKELLRYIIKLTLPGHSETSLGMPTSSAKIDLYHQHLRVLRQIKCSWLDVTCFQPIYGDGQGTCFCSPHAVVVFSILNFTFTISIKKIMSFTNLRIILKRHINVYLVNNGMILNLELNVIA